MRRMLRVTVKNYEHAKDCPFRNVLDQVGDKWSFLIFAVLEDGPKRFNEIQRLIGDISHRVLTRKLRDLEKDGYVKRSVLRAKPLKVAYELTDLGRSLIEPMKTFLDWALKSYPQIVQARQAFEKTPRARTAARGARR
jgi:DNA-binding HxlR family transcriptional regulator